MILSMKRIMLAALAAASASATAAGAAERRFTVTDFDKIEVSGPFQVTLGTGRPGSATASGSDAALGRVSIQVEGRTLRVRPNRSAWGGYPGEGAGPLKIELSTHSLRSAFVNGAGSLSIDKARTMKFDAGVSGSGQLKIANVESDNLTLGLLGSGKIVIGGKAKTLRANIQGSGDLDAAGLVADDAQISAETAGTITVSVSRSAKVTASGTGDTIISGKPACTVKALGSGRIVCGR
jgi:hypothetical protein